MHIEQKTAIVTGAAGFIGYHTAKRLLDSGWRVVGVDCMSDYYDVGLKKERERMLLDYTSYRSIHDKVETQNLALSLFKEEQPDVVIHLAAQAGVRHSIENPRIYLESNINGTFELLEAARSYPPRHMLLASTSSVYGANTEMPYVESDKTDHQMSFYAATKKSTECMAHSYSHLYHIPITMFRFFTVYGPWGRPDMALHKFTDAILKKDPIDVYNFGKMKRDFTYIDDLIEAITRLIETQPNALNATSTVNNDSISPVAPWRVVNIGNSQPVPLTDFIEAIELATGNKAILNFMPMQAGDVTQTWADASLLRSLTGYNTTTEINEGIRSFVRWFKQYYKI